MLACKRGHKEVVRVLVSYGAEIYVRDIRNRTAFDTATKRQHTDLLPFLTTQYQTLQFQLRAGAERSILIKELRAAHQKGKLKFSNLVSSSLAGLEAMDLLLSQWNVPGSNDLKSGIMNGGNGDSTFRPTGVDEYKWPIIMMRLV
jgi:hypothetical protein